MIITVFGATGQVGKRIVRSALAKGHTVRAFGRNVTGLIDEDLQNDKLHVIKGFVFEEEDVYNAVNGAGAVLSALGGAFDGVDKTRSLGIKNIAAQMQKAGVQRIVALGGSGTLEAAGGGFVMEEPEFPEQFLPVAREHTQAFLNLQQSPLEWTFVCAPTINDEDATGNYITNDTYPPTPNKNFITAGDIADFMMSEVEQPKHVKQRVGMSAT
ncbi:MAG: putative NADH-flavin reductase [Segetibacter sp.]|nr:putative NADH-flavin reductase [Segetibacter sp.]